MLFVSRKVSEAAKSIAGIYGLVLRSVDQRISLFHFRVDFVDFLELQYL